MGYTIDHGALLDGDRRVVARICDPETGEPIDWPCSGDHAAAGHTARACADAEETVAWIMRGASGRRTTVEVGT